MIFTGVFQRFPKLKFMHAEVNVGWAGYWMQQMYLTVNRPKMKGADGIRTCRPASGSARRHERLFHGARRLHRFQVGEEDAHLANAAMYSTDYQHSITLWPDSQSFIPKLTVGMDEGLKHKLLAGNAVRVFNLE